MNVKSTHGGKDLEGGEEVVSKVHCGPQRPTVEMVLVSLLNVGLLAD